MFNMCCVRLFLKYCLDSSDSGGGGLFLLDDEVSHVTCMLDMRASAYFLGEVTDGVNLDLLTVLGIELGSSSEGLCFFQCHCLADDGKILLNLLVDDVLNLLQLLLGKGSGVVEVEAETLSRDV